MHLEILDENRKNVLGEISSLSFIKRFEMGGGTALSLQMGLRKSYDFDFFGDWHFNPEALLNEIKEKFGDRLQIKNIRSSVSTLDLFIDGVQVSFFEYKHHLIDKTVSCPEIDNLSLLSIDDIACMKAVAIAQRGSKKDFFDLYFILAAKNYQAKDLIDRLLEKYGDRTPISALCCTVSYFKDAREEKLPETFVDYSWEEIERYFIRFQSALYKLIT